MSHESRSDDPASAEIRTLREGLRRAERAAVEHRRRESELQFLLGCNRDAFTLLDLVGAAPGALIGKTLDATIVQWNTAAERLYGYTGVEIIGQPISRIVPPERQDELRWIMKRIGRGQRVSEFRTERIRRDGSRVRIVLNVAPITDSEGRVVGAASLACEESARHPHDVELALKLHARILENISEGVGVSEEGGTIVYTNAAADAVFGYGPGELAGRPFAVLSSQAPEDLARTLEAIRGRLERDGIWTGELPARRRDGSVMLTRTVIWPLDVPGQRYWVWINEDLTRRRATEESVARLAAIVESSEDAIFTKSLDATITSWNAGAERLYGYTAAEAVGRPVAMLIPPGQIDALEVIMDRVSRGERTGTHETVRRRKDGSLLDVALTVSPMYDSGGRVIGASVIAQDITWRKQSEQERLRLAGQMQLLLESTAEGIYAVDLSGRCTLINSAAQKLLGRTSGEMLGQDLHALIHHSREDRTPYPVDLCPIHGVLKGGKGIRLSGEVFWRKDGTPVPVEVASYPIREQGEVAGAVVTFHDISERLRLERQLRQLQKMEAVGRLAGGVAHDFNNLLTVIQGYSDAMLSGMRPEDPNAAMLAEVIHAGERAAALTRQLLAFSRRLVLEPKLLELDKIVSGLEPMLRRLIGEDVELSVGLRAGTRAVRADAGQIEQVIVNLAINARDAMPQGGRLTIETARIVLDESQAKLIPHARPGPYLMLAVSDTGCGMDEATRARLFEPFFTTKEPGKGTGLGLATVYSILRQHQAGVLVYSEPGVGSTFKIYIPEARGDQAPERATEAPAAIPEGSGQTILLVEDEPAVRALSRRILESCNYVVLEASNGTEALKLCSQHDGPIDLLVSDVVMPQLGGSRLVESLNRMRPGIPVLYVSGYTDDAVVRHGIIAEDVAFLQKPFTPGALAQKVRQVLHAAGRSG